MKAKESSYQKLKRQLRETKAELWDLKCAIADNDRVALLVAKQTVLTSRSFEKCVWFGGCDHISSEGASFFQITPGTEGIITQMKTAKKSLSTKLIEEQGAKMRKDFDDMIKKFYNQNKNKEDE